jgi:hypothetical protein
MDCEPMNPTRIRRQSLMKRHPLPIHRLPKTAKNWQRGMDGPMTAARPHSTGRGLVAPRRVTAALAPARLADGRKGPCRVMKSDPAEEIGDVAVPLLVRKGLRDATKRIVADEIGDAAAPPLGRKDLSPVASTDSAGVISIVEVRPSIMLAELDSRMGRRFIVAARVAIPTNCCAG